MSHFLAIAICRQTENSHRVLDTLSSEVKACWWHWTKYLHHLINDQTFGMSSHWPVVWVLQGSGHKHQHCYPRWPDTRLIKDWRRVSRGQHRDGSGVQSELSQLAQFLKNAQDSLETIETSKQWPILQSGNSKTFYKNNWIQIRLAFFLKDGFSIFEYFSSKTWQSKYLSSKGKLKWTGKN